jgi:hypothetical protein
MKNPEMKNGQLWFNLITRRIERLRCIGPLLVATTHHKDDLQGWARSQFRAASAAEVQKYLDEIKDRKTVITTEGKVVYV